MKKLSIFIMACVLTSSCLALAKKKPINDDEENAVRAPVKEAVDSQDLRKKRRAGIGIQAAGALGFGGAILDLNLTPSWGMTVGYGGGQGFQAAMFQAKYNMAGEWLIPYLAFGYTRWASNNKSSRIEKTNPGILGDKLLTGDEKAAGEYQKNLVYPGLGLQFVQLGGEWAGASIFAELTVLLDMGQFVAAPTGTLGFLYYF